MSNATNKTYLVTDETGAELKTLKSLTAAKKLADAEGTEVYCEGKCVYQGKRAEETNTGEVDEETTTGEVDEETRTEEARIEKAEEPVEKNPVEKAPKPVDKSKPAIKHYRLKALMNVRRAASTNAERVDTLQEGTIVNVVAIENDWLHLANGTYILFNHGEFAEQV